MASQNNNNMNRTTQQRTSVAPSSGLPYGYVPAYLPGSASLVEQLDQTTLLVLRDGRHIVGTLISFDQFSNIVLSEASERRCCCVNGQSYHADTPLGLYVVKGDSLVLMGEVSDHVSSKEVTLEELEELVEKNESEEQLEWDFDRDLIS